MVKSLDCGCHVRVLGGSLVLLLRVINTCSKYTQASVHGGQRSDTPPTKTWKTEYFECKNMAVL